MQNEIVTLHGKRFRRTLDEQQVLDLIAQTAEQINHDYADYKQPPLFVITLSGATMFGAELLRRLDFLAEIAFVKCSSYGGHMESCGCVSFELGCTISPKGRRVIVVEDIIETGQTYQAMYDYLKDLGAESVQIATLLFKPDVYKLNLPVDYAGLEIANDFVVGFGLDYNQLGRNLSGIYTLCEA